MNAVIDFDYEKEIIQAEKNHQKRLENLAKLHEMMQALYAVDFPVKISVSCQEQCGGAIWIHVIEKCTEQDWFKLVAVCVRHFGIHFERKFCNIIGSFSFIGKIENLFDEFFPFSIHIADAPSGNCTIKRVKKIQEVEVFESDCQRENSL